MGVKCVCIYKYIHTHTHTHTYTWLNECLACDEYSVSGGYYDYSFYGFSLRKGFINAKESWWRFWKMSVETYIPHILFFRAVGHSRLTWSGRYGLIGMCTEAQPGILFRAPVGTEDRVWRLPVFDKDLASPQGRGKSPVMGLSDTGDCPRWEISEVQRGQHQEVHRIHGSHCLQDAMLCLNVLKSTYPFKRRSRFENELEVCWKNPKNINSRLY